VLDAWTLEDGAQPPETVAERRGVTVRIAYNDDSPGPDERPFEPTPMSRTRVVLPRPRAGAYAAPAEKFAGRVDHLRCRYSDQP